MIMAGALAFYSLLPQFGNLGDTVSAFGDAKWEWIPALAGAALIYFVFATVSFLGSVAQPMPIAASARGQVATAFAQLVGPASAGKMALAGRFLQRNGLTPSEASASVALNTIAGIATHLLLMVAFFAWAGGASIGGVSLPSIGTVLLVAAIAVGRDRDRVLVPDRSPHRDPAGDRRTAYGCRIRGRGGAEPYPRRGVARRLDTHHPQLSVRPGVLCQGVQWRSDHCPDRGRLPRRRSDRQHRSHTRWHRTARSCHDRRRSQASGSTAAWRSRRSSRSAWRRSGYRSHQGGRHSCGWNVAARSDLLAIKAPRRASSRAQRRPRRSAGRTARS